MTALGVITCTARARVTAKKLPVFAADNADAIPGKNAHEYNFRRPVKWWGTPSTLESDTGRVEGVITKAGVPVEDVKVGLYYSLTGVLIARTKTASDGTYKFGAQSGDPVTVALNPASSERYFVTAFDPVSEYNAVIADRITPAA